MSSIAAFEAAAGWMPPRRAPYNFVPLNETVLPTPWGTWPDLATPHPEGLSGEIAVEWRVETPLLVGGRENDQPFRLGEGGTYAIPGASLRGMIRAVLEIIGYAHLDLYADQRFSVRDFDAVTWKTVMDATGGQRQPSRAGWLRRVEGGYRLTECAPAEVPIADLVAKLGLSSDDWNCRSSFERHEALRTAGLDGEIDLDRVSTQLDGRGTLVVAGMIKSEADRLASGGSGQRTNKVREAAFLAGDLDNWPISKAALDAFDAVQVTDGHQHEGDPVENWSFWRPKLDAGERVPVFFRGDPTAAASRVPDPTAFVMALTRLMRLPHSLTTGEMVTRTQKPLDAARLDLVQALFGHVPPERAPDDSDPVGRRRAWRSRVRFGIATLTGHRPPTRLQRTALTMQPRASFHPFYLRPKPRPDDAQAERVCYPIDWSSKDARLAGRKRYPARDRAADQLPRAPESEKAAAGTASPERARRQENELTFLDASRNHPLVFRSTIRFTNLLPEELGGLVWAIGLGNPATGDGSRRLRHMLGRAKAFGHGQLQAVIDPKGARIERNAGDEPPSLAGCADAFERWVLNGLGRDGQAFADLPEIAPLLAMCDADHGAGLADHLRFTEARPSPGAGSTQAERVLAAYSELQKIASCTNSKRREWLGGQPITRDPAAEGFVLLPEYPLPEDDT